jgi:hypothetical protein
MARKDSPKWRKTLKWRNKSACKDSQFLIDRRSARSIRATLAEIRTSIDHGVAIGVRSNPKPDEIAVGFSC